MKKIMREIVIIFCISLVFSGCSTVKKYFSKNREVKKPQPVNVSEPINPPENQPEKPITPQVISEEEVPVSRPQAELPEENLLEIVYFDFDSSELLPPTKEALQQVAQWLLEHPDKRILIEGHCDERGTEEYNIGLGERRARSVKHYLILQGVEPERIDIISYGESRPLDPRHCEEAWAKNRRCEIKVYNK